MNIKAITINNVKAPNNASQQIAFRATTPQVERSGKTQDTVEFKNNFDGNPAAQVKPKGLVAKIAAKVKDFLVLENPDVAAYIMTANRSFLY